MVELLLLCSVESCPTEVAPRVLSGVEEDTSLLRVLAVVGDVGDDWNVWLGARPYSMGKMRLAFGATKLVGDGSQDRVFYLIIWCVFDLGGSRR